MSLRFVVRCTLPVLLASCLPPTPGAQTNGADDLPPSTALLGRRLFSDTILSSDKTFACRNCHRPDHAFSDDRSTSLGVGARVGRRNVPALLNLRDASFFFWDGRETELAKQVLRPISDSLEMGLALEDAVARLRNDPFYTKAFERFFSDGVTSVNLGRVLSDYVRSIRSSNSPADRYLAGHLEELTPTARRGEEIFFGKGTCFGCHSGPDFTDHSFHNTGVSWGKGDLGRQEITGNKNDCGAFKTPTLREIRKTAPYMHDGSFQTLDQVLEFYNRGGNRNPCQDPRIHPLNLSAEDLNALKAFLESTEGNIESAK